MNINILHAGPELIPVIQNMARFYAYDLSKPCGFFERFDWSFPKDGLYEGPDISKYWLTNHYPFIIQVDNELVGFALIDKNGTTKDVNWNMGEFFIVGKFQGKGIGKQVATTLFDKFPGIWEIQQMPCNLPAIKFWRKIINDFTNNQFTEIKKIIYKPDPHESNVMRFQVNR